MALSDQQTQDAIIELFKILGVSLLPSELESISSMPDAEFYFHIQKGEQDGKRISIEKVRGYAGTYNASTNTPNLTNGTGTEGEYYLVNVAGSRDFGNGSVSMAVKDVLKFEGGRWGVTFKAKSIASARQTVDLGDIGAANIVTAFNDNNFENPLTIQTASQGLVIVKATQNGIAKKWLFSGESGVYDEDTLAEAEDFLIVAEDYTPTGGNTTDTAQSLRDDIDGKQDAFTTDETLKFEDDVLKNNLEEKIYSKFWKDGDSQILEVADDIYGFPNVKVEPMPLVRSQFIFQPPRTIQILDKLEHGDEVSIIYDRVIDPVVDDIFLGIFGQSNARGSTFGVEPPEEMRGDIGTAEILMADFMNWEQLNYPDNNQANEFGIEVPFTYYYSQETGRKIHLTKKAHGGTGMALEEDRNDWNVNSVDEYADQLDTLLQEFKLKKDQFPNAKFVMYWNQGERDATQSTHNEYYDNFSDLVALIQSVIPIDYLVVTLLSENFATYASERVDGVRNALIQFADENDFCDTLDLTPYELGADNTHFTAESQLQIGQQVYSMVKNKFNL